jgi:hypothetical protein
LLFTFQVPAMSASESAAGASAGAASPVVVSAGFSAGLHDTSASMMQPLVKTRMTPSC